MFLGLRLFPLLPNYLTVLLKYFRWTRVRAAGVEGSAMSDDIERETRARPRAESVVWEGVGTR